MNQYEILMTIIAAAGAIFGVCGIVFPKLKQKGIDAGKALEKASSGLEVTDKAVDMIKAVAPNIPYINVVDMVIDGAQQGVQKAEQLYNANKISADARKSEAIQLVKDLLTAAKVTITPDLETIIDGCVEAAVFTLPKTSSDSVANSGSTPTSSNSAVSSGSASVSGEGAAASDSTQVSDDSAAANGSTPASGNSTAASGSTPVSGNSTAASDSTQASGGNSATAVNSTPASSDSTAASGSAQASGDSAVASGSTPTVSVEAIDKAIATLSAVKAEKAAAQPTSSESGAVASGTTGAV